MDGMNASDVALLSRNADDWGGNGGFLLIVLLIAMMFGFNGNGWGNNGLANAIGYENLATSNEVQRGFDNQNTMANQREILAAVNAGTAQGVATTNQLFHDLVGYVGDKYIELQRDVAGLAVGQANNLAKLNDCCCSIQRAIDGVNYNIAMQASQTQQTIVEQTQRIIDWGTGNRMADMQNEINQLKTAQMLNPIEARLSMVPTYPNGYVYSAGANPFCNCGQGCGNI